MDPAPYDPTSFIDAMRSAWPFSAVAALACAALAGALLAQAVVSALLWARRWVDPRFGRRALSALPAVADFDEYVLIRGVWRVGAGEPPALEVSGQRVAIVGEVSVDASGRGAGGLRDGDAVYALGTLRGGAAPDGATHYRGQTHRWELVDELAPIAVHAARVDHRAGPSRLAQAAAAALAVAAVCAEADGVASKALREAPAPTDVTLRCDERGVARRLRRAPGARAALERAMLVPWRRAEATALLAQEREVSRAYAPGDLAVIEDEARASERRGAAECAALLRTALERERLRRAFAEQHEADLRTARANWSELEARFERGDLATAWDRTCLLGRAADAHLHPHRCATSSLGRDEVLAEVPLAQPTDRRTSLACLVHARATAAASLDERARAADALTRRGTTACRFAGALLAVDGAPARAVEALVGLAREGPAPWPDLARGARLLLSFEGDALEADARNRAALLRGRVDPGAWFYRRTPASLETVIDNLTYRASPADVERLGPGAVAAALAHRGGDAGEAWQRAADCARTVRGDDRDIGDLGAVMAACDGGWVAELGYLLRYHPQLIHTMPRPRWPPGEEVALGALEGADGETELLRLAIIALHEERRAQVVPTER